VRRAQLVVVSKSRWDPAIRREHAVARLAVADGYSVTFLESPVDIRALRAGRSGGWSDRPREAERGLTIVPRRTLVPAHRADAAERLDRHFIRRAVARARGVEPLTVLATLPWHWVAVEQVGRARRVLDLADDWTALVPNRADRVRELCRRAEASADEITVASEELRGLFPGRQVTVLRNAADSTLLATALTEPPRRGRLAYVGTLSERFDADLVGDLLERLPDWHLDLWGQCRYSGCGALPAPELAWLLERADGRASWRGVVAREDLAQTLDGADVLLLPNRAGLTAGQDSMKLYDYSARGRPVVATDAACAGVASAPPRLYRGTGAEEIAALVRQAAVEPAEWGQERMAWAANHTWAVRWPRWRMILADPSLGPG
jgi:glycosyltransferase involved in cell wall biosynthesis